ncbi:MAG: hypothetical protein MJ107_00065 [Lachnospiraceae bacterium]|nr:hypothetical protein [Lachnospiraceae bacterium]
MLQYIKEHISGKKHIVITGGRGSGKSTLLKKIFAEYSEVCAHSTIGSGAPVISTNIGETLILPADDSNQLISSEENPLLPIPGIVTWSEPKRAVYMRKSDSDKVITIGEFNPDSTSKENRMIPVPDGFDIHGVNVLDSLINDSSEWVFIDEIGYLESSSIRYLEKLDELLDKKRVFAVVRKQEIKHIQDIIARSDVLVIDLDNCSLKNL